MTKIENALSRTTDTKALFIGEGALSRVAEMFRQLFPSSRAIVIADSNTYAVAGEAVVRLLEEAAIPQDVPFVFTDPKLYAEWQFAEQLEQVLSQTEAIPVAVGSGVVNDLTKLVSHHCARRYMCVGTAASMDGYTAYGASITKEGNKQTFSCPAPLGMLLDPRIAAAAPSKMSAAGYADLMAKIPAAADWILADAVGSDPMDPFAFSVVQDGLKEALSDPEGVRNGDVKKVEQLAEGLLLSGFAMQAIQSSRPASGAEHQFSHLWDMEHLTFHDASVSHGFKVGIGTLASTAFLEMLLATPVDELDVEACVAAWKPWSEVEREIDRVFAGNPDLAARGRAESKGKQVDQEGLRRQLTSLKTNWTDLRQRISERILPFEEVRRRLELVGAPFTPEQIGVSPARLRAAFEKMPYMRNRFSIIDVAFRCNYMDSWLDRLFGRGGIWEIK
ncbi:MAG: sn-glycerol-1-phosphate dehydrogenase [Alistipes sp.]